jgi:hypothetical protein
MRMWKHWMVALALVSGCTEAGPGAPPEAPVRVAPTRDATWPPARGETEMVVRAVTPAAQRAQQEIAGARCTAASPLYAAEFTAPARVLLPDFGSASPPVTVTCRAGDAEGSAQSRPELRGTGGFYGWPAVGISVGTGDFDGVGLGMGWYGGGTGWSSGDAAVRYPSLRVVVD